MSIPFRIKKLMLACLMTSIAWQSITFADAPVVESEKKLTKEDIVPAALFFSTNDLQMLIGGRVREEYFYAGRTQTLRDDFSDVINAWRHKASLMVGVRQGVRKYEKAASEAFLKLTNYSMWRNESRYISSEETDLQIRDLDGAHIGDHTHRNLVPLMFMEDAYMKINFDAFVGALKDHPLFLQVGYFPYWIGRGVALGHYVDGGLPHMGWNLDGNATNLEQSPAGVLLSGEIIKNLTATFYFTKWRGTTIFLGDTREPSRMQRLNKPRPERGVCKDTETWAFKLDYKHKGESWDVLLEPYIMYTRAPEQTVEVKADARSDLGTFGAMVEFNWKGFHVNLEAAGQFGHQDVFGIDRNVVRLKRDKVTGNVQEVNSHIFYGDVAQGAAGIAAARVALAGGNAAAQLGAAGGVTAAFGAGTQTAAMTADGTAAVSVGGQMAPMKVTSLVKTAGVISPGTAGLPPLGTVIIPQVNHQLLNVSNLDANRAADKNGVRLSANNAAGVATPVNMRVSDREVQIYGAPPHATNPLGVPPAPATIQQPTGATTTQLNNMANAQFVDLSGDQAVVNSSLIGNQRFRKPFKLDYAGYMFLGDISYAFENYPVKLAVAGAYISGDAYPYNEEKSRNYKGFVPQRDYNYIGHEVRSLAILFARVGPRPLNMSLNKMYAYNHYEDSSNMAFVGAGLHWHPFKEKSKMSINPNVLAFWAPGKLYKWDVNGNPNFDDLAQNIAIRGVNVPGDTNSIQVPGLATTSLPGLRTKLGFKGWQSTELASKYLGTEINLIAEYFILENLRLYTLDAVFFPGQLYKDVKGQPNRNTRRIDVTPGREGEAVYESLGNKVAYGLNVGLRYTF